MGNLRNSSIVLQGIDGQPGRWKLCEAVEYNVPAKIVQKHRGPDFVLVKPGFTTDLASTPRLFWNLVPPFGRYTAAAVVHDYLYQAHEGTRKHADQVFLEAMRELNVLPIKAQAMYRAVRVFGRGPYKRGPQVGGIV